MFKRIYILSVLLIVTGLFMIVTVSIKFQDVHELNTISENEHIKEDIISLARNAMIEGLSDINETSTLSSTHHKLTTDVDSQRVDDLITFSEEFFEVLSVDVNEALNMLASMLNEEEIILLETIFAEAFIEETMVRNEVTTLSGGYARLRLYVHASWGWFYGKLSTTALVVAITPIVVKFAGLGAAAGGPVGVVVGALIGSTLGIAIERYINHLVYRNGTAGFTYDLINTTLVEGWLVPFKITIQYNLLNAIFSIINFAGGNWSSGTAGAVRPASLPRLAYA